MDDVSVVPANLDLHGDIGKPGDLDFTNLELSMNMITMNNNGNLIHSVHVRAELQVSEV